MKRLSALNHPLFIGLTIFTFSCALFLALARPVKGQGIDLKEVKAQKEAESIKKFTDSLTLFYNLVSGATAQPLGSKGGKNVGAGLKEKAEKIRNETTSHIASIETLITKLKTANHFDDQFDSDVSKLLGSNKVKGRLVKVGGARKLFGSVLNSNAIGSLRKDVSSAAETLEFNKNEDVCKFIAVGIVVEALLFKKAATGNDKFSEEYGCNK